MAEPEPRYEFRVWAPHLDEAKNRLLALAVGQPQDSSETYVISAATTTTNVKIRGGLMDIKVFMDEKDGLERWRPTLKEGFPVAANVIADAILPGLRVETPKLARDNYTLGQFITEVVAPNQKLKAVDLTKRRTQVKVDGCTAEFTEVKLKDAKVETVAVEAEDPAAVRRLVEKLGISNYANVNYIVELRRLSGLEPPARG